MGKSKLVYKRNITDKLSVKGVLSEDTTTITYVDENDIKQEVKIADLLNAFKNESIEFGVQLKSDEDLELIESDDENIESYDEDNE
ncbi:hypothetical protein [Lacrimispora sp.]|uniref:hypothetical protein n=1 Tax=Lacrimispora sp. TaxID=2719234 RepID=UPI0028AC2C5D|nr:hypothetical protein [Lacrimispora sp.]